MKGVTQEVEVETLPESQPGQSLTYTSIYEGFEEEHLPPRFEPQEGLTLYERFWEFSLQEPVTEAFRKDPVGVQIQLTRELYLTCELLGILPKYVPTADAGKAILKTFRDTYGFLAICEFTHAFAMAASGKLGIPQAALERYQRFDLIFFHQVLRAYCVDREHGLAEETKRRNLAKAFEAQRLLAKEENRRVAEACRTILEWYWQEKQEGVPMLIHPNPERIVVFLLSIRAMKALTPEYIESTLQEAERQLKKEIRGKAYDTAGSSVAKYREHLKEIARTPSDISIRERAYRICLDEWLSEQVIKGLDKDEFLRAIFEKASPYPLERAVGLLQTPGFQQWYLERHGKEFTQDWSIEEIR